MRPHDLYNSPYTTRYKQFNTNTVATVIKNERKYVGKKTKKEKSFAPSS